MSRLLSTNFVFWSKHKFATVHSNSPSPPCLLGGGGGRQLEPDMPITATVPIHRPRSPLHSMTLGPACIYCGQDSNCFVIDKLSRHNIWNTRLIIKWVLADRQKMEIFTDWAWLAAEPSKLGNNRNILHNDLIIVPILITKWYFAPKMAEGSWLQIV